MKLLKSNTILRLANSYLVDSPQSLNLSYMWNFGSLLTFNKNDFHHYPLIVVEIIFILLTNIFVRHPINEYLVSLSLDYLLYLGLLIFINVIITIVIYKLFNNLYYKVCFVVCFFSVYDSSVINIIYALCNMQASVVLPNGRLTSHGYTLYYNSFVRHATEARLRANKLRSMIHSLNTAASVCRRGDRNDLFDAFKSTSGSLMPAYEKSMSDSGFFMRQAYLISDYVN